MKNIIICILALLCLAASCENDNKTAEENQQQNPTTDTVVVVPEGTITKMPPEAHLYDASEHYRLLYEYLTVGSGTFYHYRNYDAFASTYYKHRKVEVVDEAINTSPGVCYLWLESYLGEKKCNELGIDGDDLICYLEGKPSKIQKDAIPDVKTTKRMLRQYCHNVLLHEYDKPRCGDLDPYVFSCTYDGLFCEDWVEKYWQKYTEVKVLDVKYDKAQSIDSTDVYIVTFEFTFAENNQGDRFEDDLRLNSTLTEYANGKYEYSHYDLTDY